MRKVELVGGPAGSRLERFARRHGAAFAAGFAAGSAGATTVWHMPRSVAETTRRGLATRSFAIVVGRRVVGSVAVWGGTFGGFMLGIAIFDPALRSRGIGTFAVRTICDVAFVERRARRVELTVFPDNVRAIRAYERCGFRREALMRDYAFHEGRWRDVLLMSLLRRDWSGAKGVARRRSPEHADVARRAPTRRSGRRGTHLTPR